MGGLVGLEASRPAPGQVKARSHEDEDDEEERSQEPRRCGGVDLRRGEGEGAAPRGSAVALLRRGRSGAAPAWRLGRGLGEWTGLGQASGDDDRGGTGADETLGWWRKLARGKIERGSTSLANLSSERVAQLRQEFNVDVSQASEMELLDDAGDFALAVGEKPSSYAKDEIAKLLELKAKLDALTGEGKAAEEGKGSGSGKVVSEGKKQKKKKQEGDGGAQAALPRSRS
ncbi:hypothetical protein HOP50_05g37960 [Chloropicon primus]|uniref:Uncharacterized protein n=1 Tax=Chloropicon primus TaxID=1764295 RepID=A0A5B8MLB0_9CHLO|nr:hypothetical protein A3770_05p37850 [Chloropicon primus]UPR00481.1 hypothetical protein HOP50_05g37960 [Chloropicon primus]|eukprot:QDZ21267.1 hypothetical protein A3770_05p37850 [Chloropicon primus]